MILLPLLRRDLRTSFRRGAEAAAAAAFFAAVALLFPFALGGDPALMQRAAPGAAWIAAALAALLSLEGGWHRDCADGTVDLLQLSGADGLSIAGAKMAAHWLGAGLPLPLAAAPALLMLGAPPEALGALLPSLAIGTLYLSLAGGFGAALTTGTRRPGLLLALLILPLFLPMMILGMMAGEAVLAGTGAKPYILLQTALVLLALPLAPFGAGKLLDQQAAQ